MRPAEERQLHSPRIVAPGSWFDTDFFTEEDTNPEIVLGGVPYTGKRTGFRGHVVEDVPIRSFPW